MLVPEASALPTLTDVMKALDLSTSQVTESMQHYESNLQESLKTIENSTTIEDDLQKEIERGSNRYNYFQELAQYVNDLGEFLDAKVSVSECLISYKSILIVYTTIVPWFREIRISSTRYNIHKNWNSYFKKMAK